MQLALMTHPNFLKGEIELINFLLSEGLTALHLRKPNESELYVERFIHAIPEQFRDKIWLYGHHRIAPKYGLHSIHFTFSNPPTHDALRWKCEKSMTLHNLEEISIQDKRIESLVLGPLFSSIHEQERTIRYTKEELYDAISDFRTYTSNSIHAIGGVNQWNLNYLEDAGFDTAVLFTAFWDIYRQNGKEQAIHFFRTLRDSISGEDGFMSFLGMEE